MAQPQRMQRSQRMRRVSLCSLRSSGFNITVLCKSKLLSNQYSRTMIAGEAEYWPSVLPVLMDVTVS